TLFHVRPKHDCQQQSAQPQKQTFLDPVHASNIFHALIKHQPLILVAVSDGQERNKRVPVARRCPTHIFGVAECWSIGNTRGTTVTSPHLAVSEIEKRIPLMPASFIKSTISFNSCKHSK